MRKYLIEEIQRNINSPKWHFTCVDMRECAVEVCGQMVTQPCEVIDHQL